MLGAICGDIIGSYYELHNVKTENFPLFCKESGFTDDTVMTVATADAILYHGGVVSGPLQARAREKEYALRYRQYYTRYPSAGFGEMFRGWAQSAALSRQRSFANGGAMRVTPIGLAYDSLPQVLLQAKLSCRYTHNHPQAIRAAQAVAAAVFLARKGAEKRKIQEYLTNTFHYSLEFRLDDIREGYVFDSRAAYSVPPAIRAFLEGNDYESVIRKAISIGGDSDTIACIAGGIAQAYYREIPKAIEEGCWRLLDSGLKNTVRAFAECYPLT